MAKRKNFVFEAPRDDETDHESETESDDEEIGVELDPDSEIGVELDPDSEIVQEKRVPKSEKSLSPWDFSSYSESVVDEHSRRSTTSIDDKISKALKQHPIGAAVDDYSDEHSDLEPHHQEDYKPNEDDEEDRKSGKDSKSFFAPAEGVSFHSNSFLELHLSRPLLRACEALGYSKPTPIQIAAFSLPTLERLVYRPKSRPAIRVLILTPKELAFQVHSMIEKLAQFMTDIRCCLVVGGLSIKVQKAALRSVVATPGRMIDHLRNM